MLQWGIAQYFHAALFTILFFAIPGSAWAQHSQNPSDLFHSIKKLGVTASVLYIAAHPDDENTRVIAYLANEQGIDVSYLSLTRGSGGQNLIGSEQGEELGVLRTEELLASRRIDGGRQFFTRAKDFGYSKTAEETLAVWGEDKILGDIVYLIRRLKPDVLITRFAPDTPGHGHHQASAILAEKAFSAAADPTAFPEQLSEVEPWQALRLLHNLPHWRDLEAARAKADLRRNVGGYNSRLGLAYAELAASSRSMHKSQGFGAAPEYGQIMEYFQLVAGLAFGGKEILSDVKIGWSNAGVEGQIAKLHQQIVDAYSEEAPERSIPDLLRLRSLFHKLPESDLRARMLRRVNEILPALAGLQLQFIAKEPSVVPGEAVESELRMIVQRDVAVGLKSFEFCGRQTVLDKKLSVGVLTKTAVDSCRVSEATRLSSPFWLQEESTSGSYTIATPSLRNESRLHHALQGTLTLAFDSTPVQISLPLHYLQVDPVEGELRTAVQVLPPLSLQFVHKGAALASDEEELLVPVRIKALKDKVAGKLTVESDGALKTVDASKAFRLQKKGDVVELPIRFRRMSENRSKWQRAQLKARARVAGDTFVSTYSVLEYPHIGRHSILTPAEQSVLLHQALPSREIAYVQGSGDVIPDILAQWGLGVTVLDETDFTTVELSRYDVLVLGIRALNTEAWLGQYREKLGRYMKEGGVVLSQYATQNHFSTIAADIFPYPLTISRDRVTDESAEVETLDARHQVFHYPFAVKPQDFADWVQERGLYFASEWAPEYQPMLSMADATEEASQGSLLIAPVGKGYFIYTGLSFFRQLPATVPGASKLFANLLYLNAKADSEHKQRLE